MTTQKNMTREQVISWLEKNGFTVKRESAEPFYAQAERGYRGNGIFSYMLIDLFDDRLYVSPVLGLSACCDYKDICAYHSDRTGLSRLVCGTFDILS